MLRSSDLNLGQSRVTEGLKQQNSDIERELQHPICEHILEGSQKEQSRGCWMI